MNHRKTNTSKKSLENKLYVACLWFVLIGGLFAWIYVKYLVPLFPKDSCFMYSYLGLYCPGCGGTRAVEMLFKGEFLKAFWYHPVVPYSVIMIVWFMVSQTLERIHVPCVKGLKFHEKYLWFMLILVLSNWILKNILLVGFQITL